MKLSSAALLIGWIVLTVAPPPPAQAAATVVPSGSAAAAANAGIIEGRVLNPASGEYLGNAEVRLQGTELRAVTQSDGRYRLVNVPPGNATVVVTYTGYESATTAVTVTGGEIAVRNFDLRSSLPTDTGRNVVALDRFTVAAAREGTAKAIMEQRSAMTVKNVVATDT